MSIKKILEHFYMKNCYPFDTLEAKDEGLSIEMCSKTLKERKKMAKAPYSCVIGSLMYNMICTRPNIYYVMGLVSRYQFNLRQDYWKAIKRILRYLKGTINYFLCHQGNDSCLEDFTNTD